MKRIIYTQIILYMFVVVSYAQEVQHPWSVIDKGSGRSSDGELQLLTSLGQTAVSRATSTNFFLDGGFMPGVRDTTNATVKLAITVTSGWNIVSVPLHVEDARKTSLYPSATSSAFAFEDGYLARESLSVGKGYWLKFPSQKTMTIVGLPTATETIDVVEGWNLVGSINSALNVTSISSIPSGIVTSEFFAFSGGYITSNTIEPGKGYWVKVNQGGQLILSSSTAISKNTIRITPTNEMPPPAPETETSNPKPQTFSLNQNYPNPFNPSTVIRYELPVDSWVNLSVYDVLGKEVATLVEGLQVSGYKFVIWNASEFPSGMYFVKFNASSNDGKDGFTEVKRIMLLK
ncbi:MAG: T9SS type A sorting domain-containing protein [Ignavibacteriae bacterium]|nr:T9SS type A sorting domain-containing protein [Ignavibacteriota bacterium]